MVMDYSNPRNLIGLSKHKGNGKMMKKIKQANIKSQTYLCQK